MKTRYITRLAWTLGLFGLAITPVNLALAVLNGASAGELLRDPIFSARVTAVMAFALVGTLIASRRPAHPIGWMFLAIALSQGASEFGFRYGEYALVTRPGRLPGGAEIATLLNGMWALGIGLLLVFLPLLFPDGHLPSRRWRPVAWLTVMALAADYALITGVAWPIRRAVVLNPESVETLIPAWVIPLPNFLFLVIALCGLAALISLVGRFRRARGDERQQLKWFCFGVALTLAYLFGTNWVTGRSPLLGVILGLLGAIVLCAIPAATGIAILRHRLFDIDVIINRALVYTILSAALALVYFGGVAALQRSAQVLFPDRGQGQWAVVASTLAIAALFQPLRRRIQSAIDHRFYRRKYDAARTLAGFTDQLREETDLEHLSAALVAVVEETMQPAHASLWLRPTGRRGQASGHNRNDIVTIP
jgi:hypothetical protein